MTFAEYEPQPLWRCTSCGGQVPDDLAHRPHDPDCKDDTFCHCERAVQCALCCDDCAREQPVLPGQLPLLPEASTRGLPKGRTA